MILNVKIENFRSIKKQIDLSMQSTRFSEHPDNVVKINNIGNILKSSVIYGANASGKSNILIAIKAIEYLIKESSNFKPNKVIEPYEPFRLDKDSKQKPIFIGIEFVAINGIRYNFSLRFSKYQIEYEKLSFYPKNKESLLYLRDKSVIKYGEYYKGARKSIENKMLDNQLFLSKAILDKVDILYPAYEFFDSKFMVFPFIQDYHETKFHQLYAERLADPKDEIFRKKFNKIICDLDTGISNVESKEIDWNQREFPSSIPSDVQEKIKNDYKYDIKTQHKVFNSNKAIGYESFDKEEESKGTQSLFVLAGLIIDTLEEGAVLIVDEFEKNLHPHITGYLIKMFHSPIINKKNAQLIFATHDMTQLSNTKFRRDQIWFTEKDEYGVTNLYSMAEFNGIRKSFQYDKLYDSGQFGAVPLINDLELLYEDE